MPPPHPICLYIMQKSPIDFLSALRPDTQTTNQTLRMLGTYASDHSHAHRFNMHLPSACPGGPPGGYFHPDVTITDHKRTSNRTEHPAWAKSAEKFGFTSSAAGVRRGGGGGGGNPRPGSARPASGSEVRKQQSQHWRPGLNLPDPPPEGLSRTPPPPRRGQPAALDPALRPLR